MSTSKKIPGFSRYVMHSDGSIENTRTGYFLNDKDYDHSSGRVSLYTLRGRKVTMSRDEIFRRTFGRNPGKNVIWA